MLPCVISFALHDITLRRHQYAPYCMGGGTEALRSKASLTQDASPKIWNQDSQPGVLIPESTPTTVSKYDKNHWSHSFR